MQRDNPSDESKKKAQEKLTEIDKIRAARQQRTKEGSDASPEVLKDVRTLTTEERIAELKKAHEEHMAKLQSRHKAAEEKAKKSGKPLTPEEIKQVNGIVKTLAAQFEENKIENMPLPVLLAYKYCEITHDFKNPFIAMILNHREDNDPHDKIRQEAVWRILNDTKAPDILKRIVASSFAATYPVLEAILIADSTSQRKLGAMLATHVSIDSAKEAIWDTRLALRLDIEPEKTEVTKEKSKTLVIEKHSTTFSGHHRSTQSEPILRAPSLSPKSKS